MMITPELIGLAVNFVGLVGLFVKLEARLTKLETTQDLIMQNFINIGAVNRRN